MITDFAEDTFVQDLKRVPALDQVSFVLAIRDAIGGVVVMESLLETSRKEWDACKNIDNGDHLIRGVGVGSVKSDACYTYIAKIIKHYMVSQGVRATAWTKNTIAGDNFTNRAISNTIAAATFEEHTALLKIVATRLIGFDDSLVAMALAKDNLEKAQELVVYLGSRFELGEDREELLTRYAFEVGYFQALFDTSSFTPAWYTAKIKQGMLHWENEPAEGEAHIRNQFTLITQE